MGGPALPPVKDATSIYHRTVQMREAFGQKGGKRVKKKKVKETPAGVNEPAQG